MLLRNFRAKYDSCSAITSTNKHSPIKSFPGTKITMSHKTDIITNSMSLILKLKYSETQKLKQTITNKRQTLNSYNINHFVRLRSWRANQSVCRTVLSIDAVTNPYKSDHREAGERKIEDTCYKAAPIHL